MPPWGRPPGAGNKKARREWERQMREWEAMQQQRFQELDSDDTDDDGQGVHLPPKYVQQQEGRFSGDELLFTGVDMGAYIRKPPRSRNRSYENLAYGDVPYDSKEDEEDSGYSNTALQVAMRDKEQELVHRALSRIQRAREKGKSNVNLTPEEAEALDRHRAQQQQIAPSSPARKTKGDRPANNEKSKKRPSRLFSNAPSSAPIKSSKTRSRKPGGGVPSSNSHDDLTYTSNSNSAPPASAPGILVPGPGNTTTYTPLGFRPPRDSPPRTSRSSPSRPTSRSASNPKNHPQSTSPPQQPTYNSYSLAQYPASAYSTGDLHRPTSSSSSVAGARPSPPRSLPDDPNWAPPSRARSASSAQDPYSAASFQQPPYPTSRRANAHGPAAPEIAYSTVPRRKPVSAASAPAGVRGGSALGAGGGVRRGIPSGLPPGVEVEVEEDSSSGEQQGESSDESGGEEQGVRVGGRGAYGYGYGYASGARGGGAQRRVGR
ncbi:MAG: hypothetical protein M1821_001091 [Bathelium mastoideum]|nr:MAG: hypothetical protein M1821_001091 [Bathelium mastoideum]